MQTANAFKQLRGILDVFKWLSAAMDKADIPFMRLWSFVALSD